MKTLKRRTIGLSVGFLSMLLLILVCATSAFADGGGSLSPTLTGGSLAVANNGSITGSIVGSTTLNGTNQALTIAVPLTVTDPTGTGNGWHLSVSETQFSNAANAGTFRTLSSTAVTYTNITSVACHSGSTCSAPSDQLNTSAGTAVPEAATTTDGSVLSEGSVTPLAVYNANNDTGMGINDMTANFALNLHADTTYAAAYSSTLTIAISSAP